MSPTRVTVDDDEQQLADLEADLRRLRSRLATTAVTGTHDEFTAAATPSTTYTLTCIPLSGTCLMALNGHVQREGVDYTVNYDTAVVTVSATQASGDKITFRYLVTDWLIARSLPPETSPPILVGTPTVQEDTGVTTATWAALPTGVAAGDLLLLGIGVNATGRTNLASHGWTPAFSPATSLNFFELWWKIAGSGETPPSWTFSSSTTYGGTLRAYRGVNATTPISASAFTDHVGSGSTTYPVPTVSVGADKVAVYFWANNKNFGATTMTPEAAVLNVANGVGASNSSGSVSGDETIATAGTTPARIATPTNTSVSGWDSAVVVLAT